MGHGQRFHRHTETKTFFTGGVIIIFQGRTPRTQYKLHGRRLEGLIGKLVSVLIDTFINIARYVAAEYMTLRTFLKTVNQTLKHIEFRLINIRNADNILFYEVYAERYHFYYFFGSF